MRGFTTLVRCGFLFFGAFFAVCAPILSIARQSDTTPPAAMYDALKKFELRDMASVTNLVLKRDRAEMSFTGDFYFASPVNGRVTGAVFIGNGTFRATAPPLNYEKENLVRFVGTDTVETDFRVAVLRFSDDTFDLIGKAILPSARIPSNAQKLADELEPRLLIETGVNLSARLLLSLANNESPGLFFAQFDRGSRNRFTYILDPQTRIPSSASINSGEKVLLFSHAPSLFTNDMWIATYSETDFEKQQVRYSDSFDLVAPLHYDMTIDLREPRSALRTKMRIDFESLVDDLRVIPLKVNDGLSAFNNTRLRKAMKTVSARYKDEDVRFIQEDWETGLTILLPEPVQRGARFSIEIALEGDFIDEQREFRYCFYPLSNTSWYPRHGYLRRSTFNLLFRHGKHDIVSSIGRLVHEGIVDEATGDYLTEFRMDHPVSFASFAAGRMVRHTEKRKLSFGEMTLEFYSVPNYVVNVKESFILGELGNALDYFSEYFGAYPYEYFRGSFHPFQFGQGFPTLLLLPRADRSNSAVYSFIAHETSHQWWGNMVAWRSYRDQWLSEGFAEYSGMLYTGLRDGSNSQRELIRNARSILSHPPVTERGVGSGKVAELGPLILGLRLQTRNTIGAYNDLVYQKGALVVRMLHFLFCDPTTGSGQPFFDMLGDFVRQYRNSTASTDDFMRVAGMHFANTPIARKFGLTNLDWFFQQWVYEATYPSYRMEYSIVKTDDGQFAATGTIFQENAKEYWFMPLPVTFKFRGNQEGRSVVYARGPETTFRIPLPMQPSSVELDPDHWIFSEKTVTRKK
ncbi:MAG TPA: M1 family aminopeptidase [Acidobacteriota bacterium]|nr:M1 family aminopeptidase [Acidobacteriota bacterium]